MEKLNEYSPLVLAYIGDAVFELFVREMLVSKGNKPVDKLHKAATSYVSAAAQSESFKQIEQKLTDSEMQIFKRGRNTKSTVPKNADMSQYRAATGLESLIGYIYLTGNIARLKEIMSLILVRAGDGV